MRVFTRKLRCPLRNDGWKATFEMAPFKGHMTYLIFVGVLELFHHNIWTSILPIELNYPCRQIYHSRGS